MKKLWYWNKGPLKSSQTHFFSRASKAIFRQAKTFMGAGYTQERKQRVVVIREADK